ncbi:aldo/keto reductase, partial [Arthrospira platensis SPKY1]|nr:aldo/keto reductase [Arthrospira platensis SPKY1]
MSPTSALALGCMHFAGHRGSCETDPVSIHVRARTALETAWQSGYRLFDHADIYCGGESEKVFALVAKELGLQRSDYLLQTKCGIRPGNHERPTRYDFSKNYILESVEGSLRRLDTDFIDVL